MAVKRSAAKAGLKTAKAAPAKAKLAKGGFKLGKRKAIRTPAGTAVLYAQALVGNRQAREELRDAYTSARKAYSRSADRSGRPNFATLLDDRKASREAGRAITSLRSAVNLAGKKRKKPRSVKPVIVVVAVAGAGTAVALNENLRAKAVEPFTSSDAPNGAAATA